MFAGRSVRARWPLDAADYAELFRVVAWGIRGKTQRDCSGKRLE
jgi:hypothetical protein